MASANFITVYVGDKLKEFEAAATLVGMSKSEVFRTAVDAWIEAQGLRRKINKHLGITSAQWKQIRRERAERAAARG